MTYRKEIELVFDPSSFRCQTSKVKQAKPARIDLWYIGANREVDPTPVTPEKEFFLQAIRDHVRGLPQAQTPVKDLLSAVSTSWNKATTVVNDIRLLNIGCPTEVSKTSDSSIAIRASLLVAPLVTKVSLVINLDSQSGESGIDIRIRPCATVVYGERFNETKISEQLSKKFGEFVDVESEKESWSAIVTDLGEKLLARGRK
jgi:kinetochore protein Spc7/SPC105